MILSHGLWQRRFGGDPAVIGRRVRLNESTFTIVGVLPASFQSLTLSKTDYGREMSRRWVMNWAGRALAAAANICTWSHG